jgi:tetratricopeptide (TPR) repeat protein
VKLSYQSLKTLGEANYRRGLLHQKANDPATALNCLEEAKKQFEEIKDQKGLSKVLNEMGVLQWKNGKYDQAKLFFDQAIVIDTQLEDWKGLATCLLNYGHVNNYAGDYNAALEKYEASRDLFRKENHSVGEANALNGMANVYRKFGELSKAMNTHLAGLEIYKRAENKSGVATCLINIASVYRAQGNYALALKNYEDGILGFSELGMRREQASGFLGLGVTYWYLGEFEKALEAYAKNLAICEELKDKRGKGKALGNIGLVHRRQGNYRLGLSCFNGALAIDSLLGNKEGIAINLNHMGLAYLNLGVLDSALSFTRAAFIIAEKNNFSDQVRGTSQNLFRIHNLLGNNDSASYFLTKIREIMEDNLNRNYFTLTELEKELYLPIMRLDMSCYYEASFQEDIDYKLKHGSAYNLVLETKGLSLRSVVLLRQSIESSGDKELKSLFDQWMAKRELLVHEKNPENSDLEKECKEMEAKLVAGSQFFAEMNDLKSIDYKKLSRVLKADEVAIEFVHYDVMDLKTDKILFTQYAAIILFPSKEEFKFLKLFKESELASLFGGKLENGMNYSKSLYGGLINYSNPLYELVFKKIDKELSGIGHIYFAPTGLLHRINFAAIRDENGKYLGEKYSLHQFSATSEIVLQKKGALQKKDEVLVMGGIEYNKQNKERKVWSYLEGTKKESENIVSTLTKNGFNVRLFSGLDANEASFKKESPGCGIIHLSTHGFFFPDPEEMRKEHGNDWQKAGPEFASMRGAKIYADWSFVNNKNPLMRSGLVLAGANDVWEREIDEEGEDGVLTASEISNLNLSKAKLVVLSACETGLGDIKGSEGVYGLQRGLKMAGAKNLMMSLWKVPDEETVIFMTDFYTRLSEGKEISIAFRETPVHDAKEV